MSNLLDERFAACREAGRAALVVYLPVGFPDVETSRAAMVAAVEAGADVIEIGIPYTDPVMDGPVIQDAADRALEQGASVDDALECARAVVDAGGVPVVMSYWNPLLAQAAFLVWAPLTGGAALLVVAAAGITWGLLTPSAPPPAHGRRPLS